MNLAPVFACRSLFTPMGGERAHSNSARQKAAEAARKLENGIRTAAQMPVSLRYFGRCFEKQRNSVDKLPFDMLSYVSCSRHGMPSSWRDVRVVEGTGLENRRRASARGFESHSLRQFFYNRTEDVQKYPSGRRGSPAKGVGWVKPARGFKSLLLRQSPDPLICGEIQSYQRAWAYFYCSFMCSLNELYKHRTDTVRNQSPSSPRRRQSHPRRRGYKCPLNRVSPGSIGRTTA